MGGVLVHIGAQGRQGSERRLLRNATAEPVKDPRVDQIPKAAAGGSVGKPDSCESLEVTGGCVTALGQRQGGSGQRQKRSE